MPRKLIAEEGVHGFDRRALPIMSEPKALVDGTEEKPNTLFIRSAGNRNPPMLPTEERGPRLSRPEKKLSGEGVGNPAQIA
jgi:hypothetical protein